MKNKNVIFLIIGIIIFVIGMLINTLYEKNGVKVSAIITDLQTEDRTDDGPESYAHKYYGDYEYNGNKYKNIKLKTSYTSDRYPDMHVGDTIEIVVSPQNSKTQIPDGGVASTIGFIMIIWNAVKIFRKSKNEQES